MDKRNKKDGKFMAVKKPAAKQKAAKKFKEASAAKDNAALSLRPRSILGPLPMLGCVERPHQSNGRCGGACAQAGTGIPGS